MELPWNICPYCGVPAPGMRKEGGTMDDVVRGLQAEEEISDLRILSCLIQPGTQVFSVLYLLGKHR